MPKIVIFHATAGEGHRKIAEAIRDALEKRMPGGYSLACLNGLDFTNAFFKKSYTDTYHFLVTHFPKFWGWLYDTSDFPVVYRWLRWPRRLFNALNAFRLHRWISDEKPDVIVSTHFLSAEVAAHLKKRGKVNTTVLTVVTDYMAHQLWVNPGTDFYAVMHEETRQSVADRGGDLKNTRVSGIPIHEKFLESWDRPSVAHELGLDPSKKIVLVTSGSFGLGPTEEVIRHLEKFSTELQMLIVTGHNGVLRKYLESMKTSIRLKALGFVDYMPKLMAISDLVITKAGGSTVSECLARGVPLVIFSYIPGQEERNLRLLTKNGAARYLKKISDIQGVADEILHKPDSVEKWKKNMSALAKPHAAEDVAKWILELVGAKK